MRETYQDVSEGIIVIIVPTYFIHCVNVQFLEMTLQQVSQYLQLLIFRN